jgi:hypothetical protein
VVSRDCGKRCPVNTRWCESLPDVGARDAEAIVIAGSCVLPELIELGLVLAVESFNREQRDISVLRVDPREGQIGWPQHARRDQEANQTRGRPLPAFLLRKSATSKP